MSHTWLDDEEGSSKSPAKLVPQPPPKPKASDHPSPAKQDAPRWLSGNEEEDVNESVAPSTAPPQPEKAPRGGEIVDVDIKPAGKGPSGTSAASTASSTFMERMAQFERHRQHKGDGGGSAKESGSKAKPSPPVPTPPRSRPSHNTSPGSNNCPTPPNETQKAGSPRRIVGVIGENTGLSEESRTQPVNLNDFQPLSEDERIQFSKEIDVFGLATVARTRAANFQLRVAALEHIRGAFDALYTVGPMPALEASFAVLSRLVSDSVLKVSLTACAVYEDVLRQALFITETGLEQLTPVIHALVAALKDGKSKVYHAASHALHVTAEHDSVGPVIVAEALCTPPSELIKSATVASSSTRDEESAIASFASTVNSLAITATQSDPLNDTVSSPVGPPGFSAKASALAENWRVLGTRVDMCYSLIRAFPLVVPACEEALMAVGVAGMNCANSKVRRSAIIFVTELYKTLRNAIDPYLPCVRASATLKLLREEIDVEVTDDPGAIAASDEQRQEATDVAATQAEDVLTQLSDEQRAQLSFWIETLPLCKSLPGLYSSQWRLRKRVLDRLVAYPGLGLSDDTVSVPVGHSSIDLDHAAVVLCQVVDATITQHVPAVAIAALAIARSVLQAPTWSREQKRAFGLPLADGLFKFAASDKVPDAETSVISLLLKLAATEVVRMPGLLANAAVTLESAQGASSSKVAAKFLLPRYEFLDQLVEQYGSTSDTIDMDSVMTFAIEGLRHANAKVRRVAVNVVMTAYKAVGPAVQQRLQGLDGPVLEEVKEKIAAMAKKDRSRTAPSRRLATIVGADASFGSPKDGSPAGSAGGRSFDRPATMGSGPGSPSGAEFARSQGTSLRQRMALWRETQASNPQSPNVGSSETARLAPPPNTSASPLKPEPPASASASPAGPGGVVQAPQRKGKLIFA
jgi:hypothetical protein